MIMKEISWKTVKNYEDITYQKCNGVARIAFNRPNVRNAFRPKTTSELYEAFHDANEDVNIGVVLLSAENGGRGQSNQLLRCQSGSIGCGWYDGGLS